MCNIFIVQEQLSSVSEIAWLMILANRLSVNICTEMKTVFGYLANPIGYSV